MTLPLRCHIWHFLPCILHFTPVKMHIVTWRVEVIDHTFFFLRGKCHFHPENQNTHLDKCDNRCNRVSQSYNREQMMAVTTKCSTALNFYRQNFQSCNLILISIRKSNIITIDRSKQFYNVLYVTHLPKRESYATNSSYCKSLLIKVSSSSLVQGFQASKFQCPSSNFPWNQGRQPASHCPQPPHVDESSPSRKRKSNFL